MTHTKLHTLFTEHGQSIWYDNIRRGMLADGSLKALLETGVRGVTSNPSIFEKAIGQSNDYDEDILALVEKNHTTEEIYEALVLADIRQTADMLLPLYQQSQQAKTQGVDGHKGVDGYISLEVSPTLAADTAGTVAQAKRFFEILDRPNVMIKIPATPQGLPAITETIAAGIPVNVTLIFSRANYQNVFKAYMAGLEQRLNQQKDIDTLASVASFFVSRIDTAVDEQLAAVNTPQAESLKGHIAIDNARLAYQDFLTLTHSDRWQRLAAQGAQVQRPLWASTSTKNPAYPDTLYVDQLIGAHTVNTVPHATLEAFRERGTVAETLTQDIAEAKERLATLAELGIDLDRITAELQQAGVAAFGQSFATLQNSIEQKQHALVNV